MSGYEGNPASTDSNNRGFDQDGFSKGEFPGSAARKPLPPPLPRSLPCTSNSEFAVWERDIREYAVESGVNASGSVLTTCRELLKYCGYDGSELQDERPAVETVWGLIPPKKGQVKAVSGRVLRESIAESLDRSLTERTSLGKEMFYLNHAWPGGSNQTDGEIKILKDLAPKIVDRVQVYPVLSIFELGAGDSTKITFLLDLFEPLDITCRYYAVDINEKSVHERVRLLNERYINVECSGVHGTFEDGVAMAAMQSGYTIIISLGSTAVNFSRSEALKNLQMYLRDGDLLILGHEGPNGVMGPDGDNIHDAAYHTKQYKEFMWDGLRSGNRILQKEVFNEREWEIKCEIRHRPWRHQFVFLHKGDERFRGFISIKYNEDEMTAMTKEAGAPSTDVYTHPETEMRVYVVDCSGASTSRKGLVLPVDIPCIRHCEPFSNKDGAESGVDMRTSSEEQARRFVTDAQTATALLY